jgi:glutamate dehydrogenase (NAD(P)+)
VCFGVREAVAVAEDMRALGLSPGLEGKRVVVQGLGNVGYHAAKFLEEAGAVLVGLAEYEGAIHAPRGLNLEKVMAHRRETGSLLGFPEAESLGSSAAALELPCDILVPAALENQITKENAPRVQARIVAEGANGPTTSEGEAILKGRGVLILPDVYLNAGGVTVSYFEWLKNLSHVRFGRMEKRFDEDIHKGLVGALERMTGRELSAKDAAHLATGPGEEALVNSGLEETMVSAYREIRSTADRLRGEADLRTAAFVTAIDKIAVSYQQLGIWP